MATPEEILRVLDAAADASAFPMLDNGYVYLAATRMSLYRSDADWALVFEVFGFSPRAGLPDLCVVTLASRLRDRDRPEDFVSREAYRSYLASHPNDDTRFFFPIAEGDWQDPDSEEGVSLDATELTLRDRTIRLPEARDWQESGITLVEPPRIQTFEICRFLAAKYRDEVLATAEERRVSVPGDLAEILVLNEWVHPDLANSEKPSQVATFIQLAEVLSSGDRARYRHATLSNTHWSFWPDA